jgi:hypothetical protein
MGKKIVLILGIIAGLLAAFVICVVITMQFKLYLPLISDEELIGHAFPEENPGYGNIEIVNSQGEKDRRIPRSLEAVIQIESYPQTVTCQAEVYFVMGDPMAVMVRWRTLQCAGQNRYIELAQIALDYGFDYSECHDEKISLLLARWVKLGLIGMDDVIYPAVNDAVTPLVANSDLLTLQPALDAGLFDTSNMIVRRDVVAENETQKGQSVVLRCDGKAELFLINPGYINAYIELSGGDYRIPDAIEPFSLLPE